MASFGGLILTNRGRNLQVKAQAGATLTFTRMAIGDGSLSGSSIVELNALKNQRKSMEIAKLKVLTQGQAVVGCVLDNQDITSGFYFREIGVFAQDPDLGEILYCYGNAGTTADYIPAGSGGSTDLIEKTIDVIVIVGNAANITAEINQSLIYETPEGAQDKADAAEQAALEALAEHSAGTNSDAHKIANITGLQTALTDAKSQIDVVDTRSTNEPPSFYYAQGSKVQAEFKGLAVLNLIASGVNYAVLVTNCPWNDSSGGSITQYALVGSEIYVRRSTSPTTWGVWSSDGISYRKYLSGKDSEGIYTIVEKHRKHDGSLAERSVLSGGTTPLYTTRTITEYGPDGIAALKTETFALSYDSDGVLISEV